MSPRATTTASNGKNFKDDLRKHFLATWPPIIAREDVERLTGGLITRGRLANLDSQGQGPKRFRVGRKVAYRAADLADWLIERTTELA